VWPRNRRIAFTADELLSLGLANTTSQLRSAISSPVLRLGAGTATATATVDFDRVKSAMKPADTTRNWLLGSLVSGTHNVSVSVSIQSTNNTMIVHPTSVSVGGISISGQPLAFLIRSIIIPNYPDAVVDKPFVLYPTISSVEVTPQLVIVKAR
jgi:hypothetical protein